MVAEKHIPGQHDPKLELQRIVGGVVESLLLAPDEEIEAELRARGDDPDAAAERLRGRLGQTLEDRHAQRVAEGFGRMQRTLLALSPDRSLPTSAKGRGRPFITTASVSRPQREPNPEQHDPGNRQESDVTPEVPRQTKLDAED